MRKSVLFVMSLFTLCLLMAGTASALPMGTSARSVVPADVQQIISVDYRTMHNSPTAMALRNRVLPEELKRFESSLKSAGIDPDRDLDQLTFVSFRVPKNGIRIVGVGQGPFPVKAFMKRMLKGKIHPTKLRTAQIYPMGGMEMTFLDESTILFGDGAALKSALDTRDGLTQRLDSNPQISDSMTSVDSNPIWSVLDQQGTQNMMRSALGDAAKLGDFETVKKRLLGSHYGMDFGSGVDFNMNVVTSDSVTAATMSSLLKAGMIYKKMTATPVEKSALENVTVSSDSSNLKVQFKTDEKKFQSLMQSDLFLTISR
jgi:hypothetical protein